MDSDTEQRQHNGILAKTNLQYNTGTGKAAAQMGWAGPGLAYHRSRNNLQ